MEEKTEWQGMADRISGVQSTAEERRRGPGWRGWVLSILVAIVLSVTATLLLGGSVSFQPGKAAATGTSGSGCCPPGDAGK